MRGAVEELEDMDLEGGGQPLTKDQKDQLMGRILRDLQRAATLGLIPKDGAKISERGEFIVDPSNIEEDENKKMRTYRHKAFPCAVYGWGVNPNRFVPEGEQPIEEQLDLVVRNRAEFDRAIAAGWSADPIAGPGGRIAAGKTEAEPEAVTEVREFAPPGAPQPFEGAPAGVKGKKASKTSKKVN